MLQQLAESSAFGAVQAAQGPCTAVQQMDGEPAASLAPSGGRSGSSAAGSAAFAADYVLMARFQLQEQLQDYLGSPPVAALLQVGQGFLSLASRLEHGLCSPAFRPLANLPAMRGKGATSSRRSEPCGICSSANGAGCDICSRLVWVHLVEPCQALSEVLPFHPPSLSQADDRLPLRTVWAGVMEIAPADNSQTRNQGRGGLL